MKRLSHCDSLRQVSLRPPLKGVPGGGLAQAPRPRASLPRPGWKRLGVSLLEAELHHSMLQESASSNDPARLLDIPCSWAWGRPTRNLAHESGQAATSPHDALLNCLYRGNTVPLGRPYVFPSLAAGSNTQQAPSQLCLCCWDRRSSSQVTQKTTEVGRVDGGNGAGHSPVHL